MADQFFRGVLPYRDYFLADPPLMIIILGGIKWLVGKNVLFLQAVPFLFEAASSGLLYLILKKEKVSLAFLAPALYLFSFSILSTSDFVTGVQLVNFFALSAFYFYQKDSFKTSGFFWGLAFLVKLYGAFLLLGFLIFLFSQKKNPCPFFFEPGSPFFFAAFFIPLFLFGTQRNF